VDEAAKGSGPPPGWEAGLLGRWLYHFLPAPPMATSVLIVPAAAMARMRAF
jgi:hypothetical protein